jgi:hypothetical protein
VSEIRIYVEGGGDANSKARMREAFSKFFAESRDAARQRRARWSVILCGSRDDAFKAFQAGLKSHPDARVFLLVDAEEPVAGSPREHLAAREPWDLSSTADEQCHLMAQVMESWFLADPDALERFYGQGFATRQIPKRQNVEEVPKTEVMSALDTASRNTAPGKYHKIQHGPRILESLDPQRVRARAPHCDRLFDALEEAVA